MIYRVMIFVGFMYAHVFLALGRTRVGSLVHVFSHLRHHMQVGADTDRGVPSVGMIRTIPVKVKCGTGRDGQT